jgi:hypothetical protein
MGNKVRYANHSKHPERRNSYIKIIFSDGSHHICLYAERDIHKYEEILFDYDGKDELCKDYSWINDYIDSKSKIKESCSSSKLRKNAKSSEISKGLIMKKRNREGEIHIVKTNSNSSPDSLSKGSYSGEIKEDDTIPFNNYNY